MPDGPSAISHNVYYVKQGLVSSRAHVPIHLSPTALEKPKRPSFHPQAQAVKDASIHSRHWCRLTSSTVAPYRHADGRAGHRSRGPYRCHRYRDRPRWALCRTLGHQYIDRGAGPAGIAMMAKATCTPHTRGHPCVGSTQTYDDGPPPHTPRPAVPWRFRIVPGPDAC